MSRQTYFSIHSVYPLVVLLGCLSIASGTTRAEEVTVARYSTLPLVPSSAQQDPLSEITEQNFDDDIQRIGEALERVLEPTGYRLATDAHADPRRATLLALPLPAVHRHLGPLPRRAMLSVLAGAPWILVEDPLHRLVSFERCTTAE
jgi:type IV pili sensor histidine kinase/response regulator